MATQTFVLDGPNWAPYAIAIGTCLTTVIAAAAAYFGLTGARQNHKDELEKRWQERSYALQERALHYMERYDGRHHIQPRVCFNDFFVIEPHQEGERIKEWKNFTFEQAALTVQGLNFWEELGGMYNRQLVDRDIIDDYFGPEAEYLWKRITWFVTYKRDQDPDAMIEMQHMCETIHHRRKARAKVVETILETPIVGLGRPATGSAANTAGS